jgi:hypothetical protein
MTTRPLRRKPQPTMDTRTRSGRPNLPDRPVSAFGSHPASQTKLTHTKDLALPNCSQCKEQQANSSLPMIR